MRTSQERPPIDLRFSVRLQSWRYSLSACLDPATGETGCRFLLDDGTGIIELLLSDNFCNRLWETGMYVMVVGGYFVRTGDLPMIKVHKIVDLSGFPDREAMWYLEVIEAFKLFYQPLFEE